MPLNEADARAKLIDPALLKAGWPEDWIRREQTAGQVHIVGGGGRRGRKRIDYVLSVNIRGRLIPVALLEAKAEDKMPGAGLEQAKAYGRMHGVPLVYSSNGHRFVEYVLATGETSRPRAMSQFPGWQQVLDRWQELERIDFASAAAEPLLQPARQGDWPYQRAAVRAVQQRIMRGEKRALLSLATGTGKTRIAASLLSALNASGSLRKALFVCDRTALRRQALTALHDVFEDDAAAATSRSPERNAKVVVATYQTLGVADDGDASYLDRHYGEDYFSHIVIDECHRSAWGEWRAVLERNPNAVQIGLTATPRTYDYAEAPADLDNGEDAQITEDNYRYFGQPVYEYGIASAMRDGYLAAMRLITSNVITAGQLEREEGVQRDTLEPDVVRDAKTGREASVAELRPHYSGGALEDRLLLPDRIDAFADDLLQRLLESGGPHQKTLVFCMTVDHARRVVAALGNRYAEWCKEQDRQPVEPWAFVCTGEEGAHHLDDFKGNGARAYVACTVDLISTGVDVPRLQNVVFFRYLKSPILFHQMLGRGTRIHEPSGKLHFTVYDYTNASRLLDVSLAGPAPGEVEFGEREVEQEPERVFEAEGVEVWIEPEGAVIVVPGADGSLERVSLDDYRARIAERLLGEVDGLDAFRERWISQPKREDLMSILSDQSASADVYRAAAELNDYDLYDILANAGWEQTLRTRVDRADRVEEVEAEWLDAQGEAPARVLTALARQFGFGGTEALENEHVFETPQVLDAGGVPTLRSGGREPLDLITELKRRLFVNDREWLL